MRPRVNHDLSRRRLRNRHRWQPQQQHYE
jgi:hypothetical protein